MRFRTTGCAEDDLASNSARFQISFRVRKRERYEWSRHAPETARTRTASRTVALSVCQPLANDEIGTPSDRADGLGGSSRVSRGGTGGAEAAATWEVVRARRGEPALEPRLDERVIEPGEEHAATMVPAVSQASVQRAPSPEPGTSRLAIGERATQAGARARRFVAAVM
jgi:hypothetical protein